MIKISDVTTSSVNLALRKFWYKLCCLIKRVEALEEGGGGATPTLFDVTNTGNETIQPIVFGIEDGTVQKRIGIGDIGAPGFYELNLPNDNNTLVTSVNGTAADINGNVILSIPAAQNFANTDLTLTGNRIHQLGTNFLYYYGGNNNTETRNEQSRNIIALRAIRKDTSASSRLLLYSGESNNPAELSLIAQNSAGTIRGGIVANESGELRIWATNGLKIGNLGNTGNPGTMLQSQGNGLPPTFAYPAGYIYRTALTQIGESFNLIPATQKPVQRLIFRGTTSITGTTIIPLTGINIALILNLYGNIEISPDFRTSLNYFDYYDADGDSYRTKALLYYRPGVNNLQIQASTGVIGSESPIVAAYTVVIEFQQV